ncbi:Sodium/bile acid cotransporter 7 [Hondaea fermentalgiana]|uniref:Sodium/bile acid cotransporter 7 n=1 Tax=Hondaea fermentalgiana TaxID=2315210 RepID=A0A2R5H2Y5_9STRA|nr:Sodium/bile acid cotransporter 7 [Hondaea fermentalgiana]|eukprot:GBG34764.1 Sodium/bile acid cotransporter 7 [Hondaea fermentalgiana]
MLRERDMDAREEDVEQGAAGKHSFGDALRRDAEQTRGGGGGGGDAEVEDEAESGQNAYAGAKDEAESPSEELLAAKKSSGSGSSNRGARNGPESAKEKAKRWAKKTKAWLIKWHLPLLLIFFIIIGYFRPIPGSKANDLDLGGACFTSSLCVWDSIGALLVTGIFVISGLKLKTEAIKKALKVWPAGLYGFISILFVTTCMSFVVVLGKYGNIPEFSIGLALFCSMPTTLSSGPILVGQAKGNVALALMLTVSTNIIGVFTAPLFVSSSLSVYQKYRGDIGGGSSDIDVSVDPVPIILQLIFTILVPLAVGKVLGMIKPVAAFVKRFSLELKLLSSLMLVLIPWMKISSSAESFSQVDGISFVLMWVTSIAIHVFYLAFNFVFAQYVLRMALPEKTAVVIVCSQKTLPVAITILQFLPTEAIGSAGLVTIPVVVSHLMQILIDAVVASRVAVMVTKQEVLDAASSSTSGSR